MDRSTPANALVLVRYSGDLTTKARPTRQQFSKRLARNVKDALRSVGLRCQIERRHDRMHVQLESAETARRAAPQIARVFGVQSVAHVTEILSPIVSSSSVSHSSEPPMLSFVAKSPADAAGFSGHLNKPIDIDQLQ